MDENEQIISDNSPANEITEQLFKAIDAIIMNRLQDLEYDKYVVATVMDITEASIGKYSVTTDNNITFDAYSDRTDLFEGIQVYVRIPQGDYTKRKVITQLYEPYAVQQNKKVTGIKQIVEEYSNHFLSSYRYSFLQAQQFMAYRDTVLKALSESYNAGQITLEEFNAEKARINREVQQNNTNLQQIIDDYTLQKVKLYEQTGVVLDNPYDIIKKNNLIL